MGSPRGGQEAWSRYLNRSAGPGGQSVFLREFGSPRAMEGEVPGEEALLQKLRDSRRRFQRHMQQLLEKVRPPPPARWEGREASGEREGGVGGWGRRAAAGNGGGVGTGWGGLEEKVELGEGRGGEGERRRDLNSRGGGRRGGRSWEVPRLPASRCRLLSPSQGLLSTLGPDGTSLSLPQYNKPFEDDPLVQMSTLTYKTPSGMQPFPHPFCMLTVKSVSTVVSP